MQKILAIVAFAAISSTLPQLALAQSSQLALTESSSQGQFWEVIEAQVKNNLEQAGYTNIRIVPSSFLVRAMDKDGNPLIMVIDPDSVNVTYLSVDQGKLRSQGNAEQPPTEGTSANDVSGAPPMEK